MKKSLLFFFGTALCTGLGAQDSWVQKDSVNGPAKSVCASFEAAGQGWIVSGLDYYGFTRKMYSYNPVQDDWDNEQSIGGDNGGGLGRGSACAFSVHDKGYICTGQGDNTNFLKDMWEYDPATDTWTQKADFPGTARRGAVAFVIDGIAYVGTGEDATGLRKDFFRYDPVNNLWGAVADFAGTARKQAVGFSMGYQGYVGTGFDGTMRNDFWQYLVFQNMWVQKAGFPGTPRAGAVGWAMFPSGFIATGEDNTYNYRNDVWEYNYFTNQWTQRASLPASGRKSATAFVIGNIAYLGTGYNGNFLDDFYAYTGITGTSELATGMQLSLYPNPAFDAFTIEGDFPVGARLTIYAADGREVSAAFTVAQQENQLAVTVNGCPAGVYWYVLSGKNGARAASGSFVIRD